MHYCAIRWFCSDMFVDDRPIECEIVGCTA
jgi:hypothetical protein